MNSTSLEQPKFKSNTPYESDPLESVLIFLLIFIILATIVFLFRKKIQSTFSEHYQPEEEKSEKIEIICTKHLSNSTKSYIIRFKEEYFLITESKINTTSTKIDFSRKTDTIEEKKE
ncbi:hypothetical protein [Teredinibacter sp. KSP-S5-2]|uniref:hypothetical protein n=1 Tax=Teredinibacter sp. KSP-S5-2 TaxID=3034506 RepID=UPI002934F1EF|nr:hypothetical protein [Teredinibacter sp. KSP-S5-2]WNO11330.1 hypothetical protein P5V12_09115 [Teredinibacter sp. KSP-S5-2]